MIHDLGRAVLRGFGRRRLTYSLTAEEERILLEAHVPPGYWSPALHARYAARVAGLLHTRSWHGRNIALTTAMRVAIAATLAQVTVGLRGQLLRRFKTVLVYAEAYRDPRTGELHAGSTSPRDGVLAFSWQHFRSGNAEPHDGINLGLHEAAHALWLQHKHDRRGRPVLEPAMLTHWHRLAEQERLAMEAGAATHFRRYAATNRAEFFAVAVEEFFERPALFRERYPELYATLCVLLRQDPLASHQRVFR